ncbi:MAG: methionyl-tRNA formyltransferase [Bacteroides sp.]|nr:methionyl-tRNA formyltransferase [Bacteroides sp.]MCM1413523.1 methionyl-tRNA formyltransferase [Bacteroides sp.]MCM1471077.1 methionyl-tRNA formyltransferase [Bacteroides sp.]
MEKSDLPIVFFGTPDFAVESLGALVDGGYNVVAVVTAPDKPAGRGRSVQMSAVKEYALSKGLPVLQPERLKDEAFVEALRSLDAQLFVVIAFRMLPEVVWQMPPLGTFNLHGSLLPRYRGAAPINWAVINGEKRTGVTTFFLKHEIDTGDIIDSRSIEIGPDEDAGSVYDRLMKIGAELTVKTVDDILAGILTTTPQASVGDVEPCGAPKIFKDTCRIDWTRPAAEVHNLVRGLSPYPTAWTVLIGDGAEQGTLKIFATRLTDQPATTPGLVHVDHAAGRMTVDCADRQLEVVSLQAPGKRRMPTADFLRGCRLNEMTVK